MLSNLGKGVGVNPLNGISEIKGVIPVRGAGSPIGASDYQLIYFTSNKIF